MNLIDLGIVVGLLVAVIIAYVFELVARALIAWLERGREHHASVALPDRLALGSTSTRTDVDRVQVCGVPAADTSLGSDAGDDPAVPPARLVGPSQVIRGRSIDEALARAGKRRLRPFLTDVNADRKTL